MSQSVTVTRDFGFLVVMTRNGVTIPESLLILKLNIPIIKKIVYSTLLVGFQKKYGQVATNKFESLVTTTDLRILVAVAHCDERFKIPRHSQSL